MSFLLFSKDKPPWVPGRLIDLLEAILRDLVIDVLMAVALERYFLLLPEAAVNLSEAEQL